MKSSVLSLLVVATTLSGQAEALGKMWSHMKPTSYSEGDYVDVHVGQLWSLVRGEVPFDFYSLNWCDSTASHSHNGKTRYDKEVSNIATENSDVNRFTHESPYSYKIGDTKEATVVCKKILTEDE